MTNSSPDLTAMATVPIPAGFTPGLAAPASAADSGVVTAPDWAYQGRPARPPGSSGVGGGADPYLGEPVLRGERADLVSEVRFGTDLRRLRATGTVLAADSEARAAGYAAGWAEGMRAAAVAARADADQAIAAARAATVAQSARITTAVASITAAAGRLDQRVAPELRDLEHLIVAAAFALAEAVIARELATATEPGADAIARALAVAPDGGPVTVRLHPADLATVTGTGGVPGRTTVDGREIVLLADPGLQPGDAVADCDATSVDARIGAAVARMREVLSGVAE
jgi:flagellar assembly protein FliH